MLKIEIVPPKDSKIVSKYNEENVLSDRKHAKILQGKKIYIWKKRE
jgi:hypothetical protein